MKIEFENATIADAISKAARVAPTKGSAFDKAAGIVVTLNESEGNATILATNLEIFYMEIVDAVNVEGSGSWRFPSGIIAGITSKLPIGSGKNVTLEGDAFEAKLKSGRTTAKMRCIDFSYYPVWEPFDPDLLKMVDGLGARIEQVEWAATTDISSPACGVHMDGEMVLATDRIRLASAPCVAAPIYKPITVPSGILKPVIRTMRDVAIGIDGGQFLLMPDQATQIKTVIFDHGYPNVKAAMVKNQTDSFTFKKAELLEIIDRATVFSGHDRSPELQIIIGKGEVAVMMSDTDQGFLGDVIAVEGAEHNRHKVSFTPKNLTEAINAAPSESCSLHYFTEFPAKAVRLDGGSGYEAWIMPRRKLEGQ